MIAGKTGDESSSNSDLSSNDGVEEKEDEDDGDAQTSESNESDAGPEKHQNEVFHCFFFLSLN